MDEDRTEVRPHDRPQASGLPAAAALPAVPRDPEAIEALLTEFTNALRADEPLDVSKPADRALYVPNIQHGRDAVGALRRDILRKTGEGVFLFSGQRGSGKSTELHRLMAELDRAPKTRVFYCDLEDWLNLNEPVTLSSFLLALLSSWVDQVTVPQGEPAGPKQRFFDFLVKTRLVPESLKLDIGGGPLKAQVQYALQGDADFRRDLEANLRRQTSSIVRQAHEFVQALKIELCGLDGRCVLLADSLEKMEGFGELAEPVYESVLRLFVSDGGALRLPGVHAVYSVSPFLLARNTQLPAALATSVVVNMPSVHVVERGNGPDEDGLRGIVDMVGRRFPRWREVLREDQLRTLAMSTGGDLRDLLRAIRVTLTDDIAALPVGDASIGYALDALRPSQLIPSEHLVWLAKVDLTGEGQLGEKIDGLVLQRYLATKHLLVYLNGSGWYALHPLIRDWVHERAAQIEAQKAAQASPASTP